MADPKDIADISEFKMENECTIYITTRQCYTQRYHKGKDGWTQDNPNGKVWLSRSRQLLSQILLFLRRKLFSARAKLDNRRWCGEMLKLRRFVKGTDKTDWLRVWNATYGGQLDMVPMTVDEMTVMEKSPSFDSEGRFIAEMDGQPMGIVHAYVDRFSEKKKGFIRDFGVIPEFRGRGIEEKLAKMALAELENRGMKVAQSSAYGDQKGIIRLWDRLGFKPIRTFSLMTRHLFGLQSHVGEDEEVVLKPLNKDVDEDLRMLNRLENECFRELFDWRRSPFEQTVYLVREDPFCKVQEWFFAVLNGIHVGYVGMGIDESYNRKKNAKCGWVLGIGVLKPYRRMGIGTKLMLYGMNQLKAKGMTIVMLGVDDWNVTKAKRLYKKLGFKVARKEVAYEKTIE